MPDPLIFNPVTFDKDNTPILRQTFDNNTPIRHIVIDNFLDGAFAETLFRFFPSLASMKTKYTGINERKAEDNNFENLDKSFTRLHTALSSPDLLNWLIAVTGIAPLYTIDDRLGYGLHQGGNGSFLDIHIDYNIHPSRKLYRKLNFLLFLNPDWQDSWGGHLELWDAAAKQKVRSISPLFNRLVIFECSELSYHGYSKITVPANTTRKSCYQYYFTPLPENIRYHDTIFRPGPEDPLLKRMAIPVKDYIKNTIKKALLFSGLERFLK